MAKDYLKELYSLMLAHKFNPAKDKRTVLTDAQAVDKIIQIVNPKQKEGLLVLHDTAGFISKKLNEKASVACYDVEPYISVLEKTSKIHCLREKPDPEKFEKVVALSVDRLNNKDVAGFYAYKKRVYLLASAEKFQEITSEPVLLDYSSLSVFVQSVSKMKRVIDLKPQQFYPRPANKKHFCEFQCTNKDLQGREQEYYDFLKKVFNYKNKNLDKGLSLALPDKMKEIQSVVTDLGLRDLKVFQTEVEDFEDLFFELFP